MDSRRDSHSLREWDSHWEDWEWESQGNGTKSSQLWESEREWGGKGPEWEWE